MRSDLALAALASAAVPGMKPVAVAAIGPADDDSPEEHQQALVEDTTGRRWLVRAPLTPVAGARLQQHDELVRQLSRHVPFKVPAPVGYADVGPDGRAAVYPFVEGAPVDLRRLPAGPGLASALARAVAAVHNIPRGAFEEQDVPVLDAAGCRQRLIADVDRAAETGRVPTGLLARWEEAFDAAPLWQFATTPVHGRFRGSTVLVTFTDDDAASGRVVAVTGWEEAAVSDPAVDLAELCAQASPQAWGTVLESYTLARAQRPDPYLHVRARLHAEVRALRGLASAVAEDRVDVVRRAEEALRRMDRLTEDDDALVPVTARGAAAVVGSSDARPAAAPRVDETDGPGEVEGPEADDPREVVEHEAFTHDGASMTDGEETGGEERGGEGRDGEDARADDATMEVPVPGHLLTTGPRGGVQPASDHEADPVEADPVEADPVEADPVEADPVRPQPVDDDQRSAPVDEVGTGPQPVGDDPLPADPAGADQDGEVPREQRDDLDDEHRLAELYGMPPENEEGPGEDGTAPTGTGRS